MGALWGGEQIWQLAPPGGARGQLPDCKGGTFFDVPPLAIRCAPPIARGGTFKKKICVIIKYCCS